MYNSPNNFPRDLRVLALLQAQKGSVRGGIRREMRLGVPLRGGHWALPLSPSVRPSEHLAGQCNYFQLASQPILMWWLSNPTQIPKLRMKGVRAGRDIPALLFTHSWALSQGGEGLPGAQRVSWPSSPASPAALVHWVEGICSCFFSPQLWPHDPDHKKAAIFLWKDIPPN